MIPHEDTKRKCSMLWWSNQRRIDIVITTLNGLPRSWDPFIQGMCATRNDYLKQTLGRVHTRISLTHNKRREDMSNWRSSSHDSKKIPQVMRNMKNSILEEPLINLKHLDKKWTKKMIKLKAKEGVHLRKKKDKYSIVISWYCFDYAFVYIQLMYYAW